ncbi:MAG: RnfABCDGE type electron transport complex subunit A [Clostridiales bacterium]|nr:RnfABCDGE type electron transport complex subunit A [Clostridiales bacterium]
MLKLISILMIAAVVDNCVLSQTIGICPFLGVSKKANQAFGMSVAVIFVMLMATAVTWPIQTYILNPLGMGYMQTIVFILVIASLVQFVEIVLKKYIPSLHASLGIYLPLITTNCAVLGVTLDNFSDGLGFLESMFNALGWGVGFMIAILLFAGDRSRIEDAKPPKAFEGLPITLIAASIVALSFLGFAGMFS